MILVNRSNAFYASFVFLIISNSIYSILRHFVGFMVNNATSSMSLKASKADISKIIFRFYMNSI